MSKNKHILILTADFLQGYGLQQILEEFFYTEKFVYQINPEANEVNLTKFDLLFVHSDFYFPLYDKLITVKKKVIILSTSQTTMPEFSSLNITDKDFFSEKFQQMCSEKLNRPDSVSGNEKSELSDREKEVLTLVAKGYLNKNIADELHISINTVLTHRKKLTAKLGIKTVSGITMYAMLNGMISVGDIQ
jgi:DNA-binding CsgD family transcriptional regulator